MADLHCLTAVEGAVLRLLGLAPGAWRAICYRPPPPTMSCPSFFRNLKCWQWLGVVSTVLPAVPKPL